MCRSWYAPRPIPLPYSPRGNVFGLLSFHTSTRQPSHFRYPTALRSPSVMGERLHYFAETTTPVAFDVDNGDEISNEQLATSRPTTDAERAVQHARQFQLWSDEARRHRAPIATAPGLPPRSASSSSLHNLPPSAALSVPVERVANDRPPTTVSERARTNNRSFSQSRSTSTSSKNLRIRITPSPTSSSKSLMSDGEPDPVNTFPVPYQPPSPRPVPESTVPKPAMFQPKTAPAQQLKPTPKPHAHPPANRAPNEAGDGSAAGSIRSTRVSLWRRFWNRAHLTG